MTESKEEPLNRRIIFIGDDGTGKTTIISAFVESNPYIKKLAEKEEDPDKLLEVPVNSEPKIEPEEPKQQANDKSKKKDKDSDSEDSDESTKEDPVLAAEIDTKLVYSSFKHGDQIYNLAIWDTPNEADFKDKRAVVYSKADVLVLLYAIDAPKSFKNISKKWKSHLKKNLKDRKCPVFLVGNKLDLRIKVAEDEESDEDDENVSTKDGQRLAKKIGAIEFFECSAINKEGISKIFERAVNDLSSKTSKPSKCMIS